MTFKKYAASIWIAAAVLGNIALFSARAVYLDEPFFIALTRVPRAYGFLYDNIQYVFFGIRYPLFGGGTHPPAVTYYLAAIRYMLGDFHTVAFRLLYSVFGIAAALAFCGLSRRRCSHPVALTFLFVCSPAFFLMSQTLMMDVPMLAFLLLGLHYYFETADGKPWRPYLSATCFSLSVMTGYSALVPLVCLFVVALVTRQPKSRLAVIAVAPCLLGAWLGLMELYYSRNPMTIVVEYFAATHSPAHNILATPSFLGGVTFVPWLFLIMLPDRRQICLGSKTIPLSLAVAVFLSTFIRWISVGYGLWFILLASSGMALFFIFGIRAAAVLRRKRTPLELLVLLWFPATIVFYLAVAQYMTARYLLLVIPPLYLLLFDRSSARSIAAVGIPTLLVSLAIAAADYRLVRAYPEWVSRTVPPLQAQGYRVLSAAESGLRFYLEERGIRTLAASDLDVSNGDLIIRHTTLFRYSLAKEVEDRLQVRWTYVLNDRFPVRTFCQEAGAGFHGSSFGLVPYAISEAPCDKLEIAEVVAKQEEGF